MKQNQNKNSGFLWLKILAWISVIGIWLLAFYFFANILYLIIVYS